MTIHIYNTPTVVEARKLAQGAVPTVRQVITTGAVLEGRLRGVSDKIVLHFDPAVLPEKDRVELMQQVSLASKGDWETVLEHSLQQSEPVERGADRMPIDADQIRARFFTALNSLPPTEAQSTSVVAIQDAVIHLASAIEREVPAGRHKERALEDLEAVAMRAIRGIFAS